MSLEQSPRTFLYLLQTEDCLPEHLKDPEAIGNDTACQCDVLVLSYRSKCYNATSPHIEYIFNSSTTWATGRNLLYEAALERNMNYLYYIFMDDDIYLETKSPGNPINPWRLFEDFLERIEPAVGIADASGCEYLPSVYKARKEQGCILDDGADYVPTPRFDAAFNAFHHKAVGHLLPYTAMFDAICWWYSAIHIVKSRLKSSFKDMQ